MKQLQAKNKQCPKIDVLKKNRKELTEDERKEVMAAGAVWHHGPNGEKTPAVWKSEVNGNTWYVCNTHRAYQCKSTLTGAINSYEFIETTASNDVLIKNAYRKRIKDRGITWKEKYHERSIGLKKRYDKNIGPKAYLRWEGHDYTTNGEYFIVVGPSLNKELKKRFFSGIKRLPEDPKAKVYAPYGEYFSTNIAALSYASDKWGLPFPREVPRYSLINLANVKISRHIKG